MSDGRATQRALMHRSLGLSVEGAPVPERVLASWQRSEAYGVSLEAVDPVFTGTFDEESLFFECGREVLTALHKTLANEPISLMLTDSDGLVLNRFSGDTSLLQALDAVHLAPGFGYSEREAGTNGLGLALADRVPVVVHAEQHYSVSLCGYTCAAVPVLDPLTGRLEGAVNLTTWSRSSSDLLLALAQSAAGNTAALMLARTSGRTPRPQPRGEVFRVETAQLDSGNGSLTSLSSAWTDALDAAAEVLRTGRVLAAIGEPGSGRATLAAQAQRRVHPRDRILCARSPAPQDVEAWLSLWTPELGKQQTGVVVCDVETLPQSGAQRLRDIIDHERRQRGTAAGPMSLAVTAQDFGDLPPALAALVDAVVPVPALRDRPDDVLPLAQHAARRARGRDLVLTRDAERALRSCGWPGNVDQLVHVVGTAARRTDTIDVHHLPPEVFSGPGHRLTRIETLEREEIVRALTRPGATVQDAADHLGVSRATIYRKLAQYNLHIPGRGERRSRRGSGGPARPVG
jgi:transcriptional regulator of acetoin/glycerol metabolism